GRRALVHLERLVRAGALALGDISARVDDEPVQPGRELRLAAKLLEPHAQLRKRVLRRVAGILGIAQEMPRQALDPRRMAGAARVESARVPVLRALDEDRVREALVDERR